MISYSYYPGCSYHSSGKEYDLSARMLCQKLGIQLTDVPDWNCCGASSAHATSPLLATSLAARNLVLAEKSGRDIVTSCAACYQRLAMANHDLKTNERVFNRVNKVLDKPYQKGIQVKSILQVISELDGLEAHMTRSLSGFKAVAYYGCLLVKPSSVQIDDAEDPQIMDNLLKTAGVETLDWGFKTECCGASLAVSNADLALKLIARISQGADQAGANCIVTACPLCHFNLDMQQAKVNKLLGTNFSLPVFYFTQLLGLGLGIDPGELSFKTHFVNPGHLIKALH